MECDTTGGATPGTLDKSLSGKTHLDPGLFGIGPFDRVPASASAGYPVSKNSPPSAGGR